MCYAQLKVSKLYVPLSWIHLDLKSENQPVPLLHPCSRFKLSVKLLSLMNADLEISINTRYRIVGFSCLPTSISIIYPVNARKTMWYFGYILPYNMLHADFVYAH